MHAVILSWFPEEQEPSIARFRKELPEGWTSDVFVIPFGPLQPGAVPDDVWAKTAILISHTALPPPEAVPKLRWIHLISAGVNHVIEHPLIKTTDIPVTTVSGIHAPPMAEWVVMASLILSKDHHKYYNRQKEHKWISPIQEGMTGRDWLRRRVGILGYGSIGRQVANLFRCMGAEIHAFTAFPRPTPESRVDRGYIMPGTGDPDGTIPAAWYSGLDRENLHAFFRTGLDMVVVCLPLTPRTRGIFGEEELRLLGPRCILVNVARGEIIDQPALVRALNDGTIAGAALDVQTPEPLPAEDPLWDAKNVLIWPHASAAGVELMDRAFEVAVNNLARFFQGETLINELSRDKGY